MNLNSLLTTKKNSSFKTMIIAAHYDDETISMGSRFPFLGTIYFVHTTNSSPSNLQDALKNGFDNEDDYQKQRKLEFKNALQISGITDHVCYQSGIPDQESTFNIRFLISFLTDKINDIKPDIIFTHPYEGGHPDHDTTSFVVNKASKNSRYTNIFEFSSYHSNSGALQCCKFLDLLSPATEIILSDEEKLLKADMLKEFYTQRDSIQYFELEKEVFRLAPEYNYRIPPHDGLLYYENFNWGITGKEWRKLVNESS